MGKEAVAAHQSNAPIVVIDDEEPVRVLMRYLLGREGFTVETAGTGEQGLKTARRLRPPVVILDIMLPDMDGYTVCEEIKQDPRLAGTRVLMVSVKDGRIDREHALRSGADEYLCKPFYLPDIARSVRLLLDDRRRPGSARLDQIRDSTPVR